MDILIGKGLVKVVSSVEGRSKVYNIYNVWRALFICLVCDPYSNFNGVGTNQLEHILEHLDHAKIKAEEYGIEVDWDEISKRIEKWEKQR